MADLPWWAAQMAWHEGIELSGLTLHNSMPCIHIWPQLCAVLVNKADNWSLEFLLTSEINAWISSQTSHRSGTQASVLFSSINRKHQCSTNKTKDHEEKRQREVHVAFLHASAHSITWTEIWMKNKLINERGVRRQVESVAHRSFHSPFWNGEVQK